MQKCSYVFLKTYKYNQGYIYFVKIAHYRVEIHMIEHEKQEINFKIDGESFDTDIQVTQ